MARDVPDGISRFGERQEDAIALRYTRGRHHEQRVPALDPVRLAHRTQPWKDYFGCGDQALRIGVDCAIRLDDVHEFMRDQFGRKARRSLG